MKSFEFIRLTTIAAAMSVATAALAHDPNIDRLVLQPDGLHKAALASGGTYQAGGRSPPKYRMDDLNSLVAASPTIVVASVSDAIAELQDNGRFLRTNCQLNIVEIIKGNFAKTDLLEMPGGTYTFSDGAVVNWMEPVWTALRPGTTYVLFLHRWEDEPDHFRVVSAGQGIFEITSDGQHLVSHTYVPGDPLSDDASAGREAFLKKVRSIVVATPLPASAK
jgi:hypothetical protein